jgi:thiamine biosynthesis lipoprotein
MRTATEWPLWSTTARLVVDAPEARDTATVRADARRIADVELGRIDAAVNRFRPDSEIRRIAGRLPHGVTVSPLLAQFVRRALDAAVLTGGRVDPAVGRSIDAIGYDRDIALIEDDAGPVRAVVSLRPPWRSVRLDGDRLTVPAHLRLDLGATAKALAADLVAARTADVLGYAVLLSLGGDIATAGPEPAEGWHVLVQDGPCEPAATVRLTAGCGLATSSTIRRTWTRGGETLHHIVDPRTGLPAPRAWRTVSVAATSCVLANAYATAAVVTGSTAPGWLDDRAAARLVAADGAVTAVGGWPAASAGAASIGREVRHG